MRKKAKYLHDAPPEALRPVLGPNYNHQANAASRSNSSNNVTNNGPPTASTISDASPPLNFFTADDNPPSYALFTNQTQNQMPPPLQARLSYTSQQSPLSPTFQTQVSRNNSLQTLSMPQVTNDVQNNFGGALFDPSNPALFNFDLEGINFGNTYGALEFGMLGHLSSGAITADTPIKENGSISSQGMGDGFNNGVFTNNINQYGMYGQDMLPDFVPGLDRQNSGIYGHHGLPQAYAIAGGNTSHHSPNTESNASPSATTMGFESSPTIAQFNTPHQQQTPQHRPAKRQDTKSNTLKTGAASVLGKRRDPSAIYDTVQEPYPYTNGFHALTAFLQRRFSPNKTLRIAKSLASIRPSFIANTKTLNRQDLIFMEKCFQRTLFEYEHFMLDCCTPTLVCRRTGEVAAVNKEFTLLTGWRKDVLLGKEANLNINTGKTGSAMNSGAASLGNSGRAGMATPRMRSLNLADTKDGKPQPVFLAELLDDDSVIEFYEDFARLAYGDSRGSVNTRCKLLKYQPKENESTSPEIKDDEHNRKRKAVAGGIGGMGNRVREIDGEHGIARLEKEGGLDCSYCWTVKRDVFDIPMMIVMNVSALCLAQLFRDTMN